MASKKHRACSVCILTASMICVLERLSEEMGFASLCLFTLVGLHGRIPLIRSLKFLLDSSIFSSCHSHLLLISNRFLSIVLFIILSLCICLKAAVNLRRVVPQMLTHSVF